jgi:hypothetical protein
VTRSSPLALLACLCCCFRVAEAGAGGAWVLHDHAAAQEWAGMSFVDVQRKCNGVFRTREKRLGTFKPFLFVFGEEDVAGRQGEQTAQAEQEQTPLHLHKSLDSTDKRRCQIEGAVAEAHGESGEVEAERCGGQAEVSVAWEEGQGDLQDWRHRLRKVEEDERSSAADLGVGVSAGELVEALSNMHIAHKTEMEEVQAANEELRAQVADKSTLLEAALDRVSALLSEVQVFACDHSAIAALSTAQLHKHIAQVRVRPRPVCLASILPPVFLADTQPPGRRRLPPDFVALRLALFALCRLIGAGVATETRKGGWRRRRTRARPPCAQASRASFRSLATGPLLSECLCGARGVQHGGGGGCIVHCCGGGALDNCEGETGARAGDDVRDMLQRQVVASAPPTPLPPPHPPRCSTCTPTTSVTLTVCAGAKNSLLLPCRHLCVCTSCSAQLSACPICRQAIQTCLTVFQ